jgi:hypothetical protein
MVRPLMPYKVEADVEPYGWLISDDDSLLARAVEHRWAAPFPDIPEPIPVTWEPGELLIKPNIFRHNLLRDFAVDDKALQVITAAVGTGIRVYAKLLLGDSELSVIQATEVLDVVDVGNSIPSEYSWSDFSFPHIPEDYDLLTDKKFFRVPNRGADLSVFLGDAVKRACDQAGLTGWLYYETRVMPDEWELGLS